LAGDCEEGAREDEYEEGGSEGGQSATGNSGSGGGGSKMDDERLKAFNLFVRFFVDENLDRMVPISKQPKEKLSGILEACDRQFPEFSDRARKRVRTYLKACRRNGRKNGGLPQELPRTTPAHLTSATAEGILEKALAGERELQAQLHPARLEQAGMPQAQQLSRPDRPAEQQ
uniref:Nucleolar protein 4-like b n=1 Tax=Macrostomum lignano TaxID=282301 RepID=A0A1I8H6X2_9PLAT